MAVDIFTPRSLTKALNQKKRPVVFLRDMFFGKTETHNTEDVDIHVKKGLRRVAPYVASSHRGKLIERTGHIAETFKPPYLKPKMVTTAEDALTPMMGEIIYSGKTISPLQRVAKLVLEDMEELSDMIDRREDLQASEALFGGVVTIKGEGVDTSIDFGIPAANKITLGGGDLWSAGTSTPYNDLKDWKRQGRKASGTNIDVVVMGREAVDALLDNDEFQKKLDTRRLDLGSIKPEDKGNGVTFVGDVKSLGLEIWAYDEWYIDPETLIETELVPSKEIMMTSKSAMRKLHYGVIKDLKSKFNTKRFAKSWEDNTDVSERYLMVQSAPLCVPHQVDAIINATVLA